MRYRFALFVAAVLVGRGVLAADAPERPTITLPVRVHLLQSDKQTEFQTTLAEDDIKRIFGKVNKVWAQAGIQFELESIAPTKAEEVQPLEKYATEFQRLHAAMPKSRLSTTAINVCYIKKFTPNGVWYAGMVFVKDTAHLNSVEDGLDEPLPRVTSHELGHVLGLPHRQDRVNLMASGTNGFSLNDDEIKTTRERAIALKAKLAASADAVPKDNVNAKVEVKSEGKADVKSPPAP